MNESPNARIYKVAAAFVATGGKATSLFEDMEDGIGVFEGAPQAKQMYDNKDILIIEVRSKRKQRIYYAWWEVMRNVCAVNPIIPIIDIWREYDTLSAIAIVKRGQYVILPKSMNPRPLAGGSEFEVEEVTGTDGRKYVKYTAQEER